MTLASPLMPLAGARVVERWVQRALLAPDPLSVLLSGAAPPAAVDETVHRLSQDVAGSPRWREAVAASEARARRIERAQASARKALEDAQVPVALSRARLGPAWQSDIDVFVAAADHPRLVRAMKAAGLLDVQPLLGRIGRATKGVHRFGVVEDGRALASVELCGTLYEGGPDAAAAVRRARAEGGEWCGRLTVEDAVRRRAAKAARERRVSLRSLLELTAYLEDGHELPREADVDATLHRCATLERELGTDEGPVARAAAERNTAPDGRWVAAGVRRRARAVRRRVRPARLVVAFSGIDGAGKSTQSALLVESLERLEVPARAQWLRIGYSDSKLLPGVARVGRRLLRGSSGGGDAMKARAAGASPDAHATRRGLLGWGWALVVTLNFVLASRATVRRVRSAVLASDRALPDALVGLEQGYGGAVDLSLQRTLMERLTPTPDLTFYMRLSPAVAYARKEDIFAAQVLESHARAYDEVVARIPRAVTMDAERPLTEISLDVLRMVCDPAGTTSA